MTIGYEHDTSRLIAEARRVKRHLDAAGVGIAIFGVKPDDDEPWSLALVIGADDVAALETWHDGLRR